ncbi:NAD-dependent epimerase/dehydratase family protein [Effusibacillus consociatus]|uniref:NAD-dependent epimerase/dehydratase family protein n=1 Tax=Effusibacillus consociatus TaxID=1117041 RepID=A0ABV9Q0L8_9BACL
MNIVLTGGSGFIGRNILEFLSKKYTITAPSRQELDLIDEKKVRHFFATNKIDIIIHSAVKPAHRNAKNLNDIFYHNTRMFFNLIRNREFYSKMIFLSSGSVYDMRHYTPKMSESCFDRHVPADEHGFAKYVCAKHIELLEDIVELRLFGVFGKFEDYAIRFISNAICKTHFNLPITIKQNRRFDYLYVNDLMQVLEYFIHNKPSHAAYNVTPNESIELGTIAEIILAISGKELPILVQQPGLGMEYSGDNTRLCREIEAMKFTPIEEAIHQLFNWYSSNLHVINRDLLLVDK